MVLQVVLVRVVQVVQERDLLLQVEHFMLVVLLDIMMEIFLLDHTQQEMLSVM